MDTNEFLAASYPELAELLAGRLSATPEPQPLDISPWICQSLLQKSIRRGETGHALRAAASLLRDDPDKLWKRLAVAVFEDVGLGDLSLLTPVLIATSGKGTASLRRPLSTPRSRPGRSKLSPGRSTV